MGLQISRATINDLTALAPLFDQYRQFYKQSSNLQGANEFLRQRLQNNESVIFIARVGEDPVGFTQLYPGFSSVRMGRSWLLNDLFVSPNSRKQKIGERLIAQAVDFARADGALSLSLATARDNPAQKLYERLGWKKDEAFFHFKLTL